jgi:hypothetical protein
VLASPLPSNTGAPCLALTDASISVSAADAMVSVSGSSFPCVAGATASIVPRWASLTPLSDSSSARWSAAAAAAAEEEEEEAGLPGRFRPQYF